MGASESIQVADDDGEEEEDDDENENDHGDMNETRKLLGEDDNMMKKVLEQEPEMSPCHASASPLSPQLSSFGTPRLDPSIKVWDPYNVLVPSRPPHITRSFSSESIDDDDRTITELYLICHGECHMSLRPDLVGGRCPEAALTPNGKRQARALAVFLKSQGIRFNVVYTSPLDRARATAVPVCQEMNLSEHMIQASDALQEMSQGVWEGCQQSDVYSPSTLSLMERFQPDFCAPSGESLRQVEFRMLRFLNATVVSLPEKLLRCDFSPPAPAAPAAAQWDTVGARPRQGGGMGRRKSSKSRLQVVSASGDHEADDEMSPRLPSKRGEDIFPELNVKCSSSSSQSQSHPPPPLISSCCVGVFSHSVPIKCLVTGLLGCSPIMSNKICIQDSSVTVLQHSWKMGWQIKRLNDTSHLRLL